VPRIVATGRSKLVRRVRPPLDPHYGIDLCRQAAFDAAGARVGTAMIWEKDGRGKRTTKRPGCRVHGTPARVIRPTPAGPWT
jgi:hypothetical protein